MSSASSNDGSSTITVTFKVGYPLNIAAVDVQNRVSQAASSLPAIVNQGGVTIKKQNPNFVLIVNLTSPTRHGRSGHAVQLRLSADRRSAEAPARRRRRADLRRAALFDARLARSRQARQSRPHRGRRRERHRRAERAGRGRQDRPVAGAAGHPVRNAGQCGGTAHRPAGILQHRRARRSRQRRRGAPARRRARRARRAAIFVVGLFRQGPDGRARHLPDAGLERARPAEAGQGPRWRSCRSAFLAGCRLRHALRHDALRLGRDARRRHHADRGAAARRVRRLRVPAKLAHDDHSRRSPFRFR